MKITGLIDCVSTRLLFLLVSNRNQWSTAFRFSTLHHSQVSKNVYRPFGTANVARHMSASASASPLTSSDATPKTVAIAGAGVIGISTAYYLSVKHNIKSILIDPTGSFAPAASGKAGGFLALDWNDHIRPLGALARRSFALHAELASDLGSESIMYRRLSCVTVSVREGVKSKPAGRKLDGVEVDWVIPDGDANVVASRNLGDETTIAQVHPKMLCEAMVKASGAKVVRGEVVEPTRDPSTGKIIGARLKEGSFNDESVAVVPSDALLFACGPWTQLSTLMGRDAPADNARIAMYGVKYHSALVPTPGGPSNSLTEAIFFDGCGDPEVYPRPDGTAYCTGFPDPAVVVIERPGEEAIRPEKIARITDACREAAGEALSAKPVAENACYLPTTGDGLPIMGVVPEENGCYVAAGHSCWGILMGPATGEAMAELIASGGKTLVGSSGEVDLKPFDPARFLN